MSYIGLKLYEYCRCTYIANINNKRKMNSRSLCGCKHRRIIKRKMEMCLVRCARCRAIQHRTRRSRSTRRIVSRTWSRSAIVREVRRTSPERRPVRLRCRRLRRSSNRRRWVRRWALDYLNFLSENYHQAFERYTKIDRAKKRYFMCVVCLEKRNLNLYRWTIAGVQVLFRSAFLYS